MPILLSRFIGWFKKKKNTGSDNDNLQEERLNELTFLSSNPALQQLAMMLEVCVNILTFLDTQGSNSLLENQDIARLWSEKYGTAPSPGLINVPDNVKKSTDPTSTSTTSVTNLNQKKEEQQSKPQLLQMLDQLNEKLSLIEQKLATPQLDTAAKDEARNEVLILKQILTILLQQENQFLVHIQQEQQSAPRVNAISELKLAPRQPPKEKGLLNKVIQSLRSKLKAFQPKPSLFKRKSKEKDLIFSNMLATMQKQRSLQETSRGSATWLSLRGQRSKSYELKQIAATWSDTNNQEISLGQPLDQISAQNNASDQSISGILKAANNNRLKVK